MAMGVLLWEPFGRLRNHLVHGLITGINGNCGALRVPGVRELMAEAKGGASDGRWASAVRIICCAEMPFYNPSKVRRWTESHHSVSASIAGALIFMLSFFMWKMSTADSHGSHLLGFVVHTEERKNTTHLRILRHHAKPHPSSHISAKRQKPVGLLYI